MSRASGSRIETGGADEADRRVIGGVQKKTLNRLARTSRFVRRRGKLTPYEFVVLMTVGQLSLKHPSLSAMVQALEAKLTREGLHQRFTPHAVGFMQACLSETLRHKLTPPKPLNPGVLRRFVRVRIFDSSSWDVDPKLRAVLPGCGGGASVASGKLQAGYEYKCGELDFVRLTPGTCPDQTHSATLPAEVLPGELVLTDLGYFRVGTFRQYHDKGAFFLSRFLVGTTLRDAGTDNRLDLPALLGASDDNVLEFQVIMANTQNDQTPCRLIGLRVSAEVANERRRKLRQKAKKQGRMPKQAALALCDWMLLVTNIPTQWLPAAQAYCLYGLRWQIELLFKQLKSVLGIHKSNTAREDRLRCELYGKLLMAVLVHRVHAVLQGDLWNTQRREVSFDKLHKRFQERAFLLLRHFLRALSCAIRFLQSETPRLLKACLKVHQPSRQTTLQRLDQIFPPRFSASLP
jgi:hypothetical protein